MTTQEKLNAAITQFGVSDIRTLKLSQERNKEIVKEMKENSYGYNVRY